MNPAIEQTQGAAKAIDCALLVLSCDAYADLWEPCFKLLHQYWPDCPFPTFLGAEKQAYTNDSITTLHSSVGSRNWSGRLLDYLGQVRTAYVLVMLDDFFLRESVSSEDVLHGLAFARRHDAIQVRLVPLPGPTASVVGEPHIGVCDPELPYRLSTQVAIWNRTALMGLLRPGESIWEFEHAGNMRARVMERGFYAAKRIMFPYIGFLSHHVVEKGQWLPSERWIFRRKNLGCDFKRRKTMPITKALIYQAVVTIDNALGLLPWRLKKSLKKAIKRLIMPIFRRQLGKMSGSRIPDGAKELHR